MPRDVSEQEIRAALFLLKESLEREKRLSSQGITLEAVYHKTASIHGAVDTIVRDQMAQGMRMDRHRKDFITLRKKVDLLSGKDPDEPEDTGSFRVEDAEKAQKIIELQKKWDEKDREKRDSVIWWKRQRYLWVGICAAGVFAALLSGCASLGVWWFTHGR